MTDSRFVPTGRGRRRRRLGQLALPSVTAAHGPGAKAGTPRFLRPPRPEAADRDSAPEREARGAAQAPATVGQRPVETPLGRAAAAVVASDTAPGKPLDLPSREAREAQFGADFASVRVHPDSPLAGGFGANAVTYDSAIHFAPGAYRPGTAEGEALISHELAHVAQQDRFGSAGAQFDLAMGGMDTGSGWFEIDMHVASNALAQTGLRGTITFTPREESPYSNRIGLIQTLDLDQVDASGVATDRSWAGTTEADRESVKTPTGEHVDMLHANQPATRNTEPWYWQGMPGNPDVEASTNHFGWNRGGGDLHDAQLWDWPKSVGHRIYDFETVAVGRDNGSVYGALNWGFEVNGATATVSNEYASQSFVNTSGPGIQHQSDAFEGAREMFREFYVHEPEVIYFDTAQTTPLGGELDKLSDAATYLAAHPEVDIELTGSADTRGSTASNRTLALGRIGAVEAHLVSLGISPTRIHRNEASAGESAAEGSHGPLASSAGSLLANRRVVVRYQRMMSLP